MDWEIIEREYRAGQLSVSELARRFGCSRAAIQKKARQNSWSRDLTAQVRQQVATKVAANAAPRATPTSIVSEEEIIDAASDRGAAAVEGHLGRAARLKRLADRIAQGLERVTGIAESTSDDPEKPLEAHDPGFPLFIGKGDGMASMLKCLADVTERIARLERTALNLDDPDKDKGTEFLVVIG
jgi:hypothetical protein